MRLTKAFFLNIPRTGSVWVKTVLRQACTVEEDYKGHQAHNAHARDLAGKFLFTFIRHPLTWYQSYFAKQSREGWEKNWHIKWDDREGLNIYEEIDFNCFMKKVLANKPNFYSQLVQERLNLKPAFVGRMENLSEDLLCALRMAGEPFNPKPIETTKPLNVSLWYHKYDATVRRELLWAEQKFISTHYKETQTCMTLQQS